MNFTTDRLLLTEMTSTHESALLDVFSHPDFFYAAALQDNISFESAARRYVGWAEDSRFAIPRRSWFMSIYDKITGDYIGGVVLVNLEQHFEYGRQIEIGYFIKVFHQSKGYASEAAQAMRQFAVEDLKVDSIYTTVAPANVVSQKILEKMGLQNVGLDDISIYKDRDGSPAPRFYYRLTGIQSIRKSL